MVPAVSSHCRSMVFTPPLPRLYPSYTSQDMKDMHDEVKANDLIFINEMGLDPGIDHMSAMEMLDDLRSEGGKITGFRSFTGG